MRHYIPLQTATGWAVAYGNHRGEFVSVMECPTLETAYEEARLMTMQEASGGHVNAAAAKNGNSYMRRFQE